MKEEDGSPLLHPSEKITEGIKSGTDEATARGPGGGDGVAA
jgi:hypothetical protein